MTIRIGILGAARIAPKAVIVPARDNPEFQIVAVAARDKVRARTFADIHHIPEIADDYSALIARNDLDLVYIALPTVAHRPWSMAALQAGKAVLCEKPFALDAREAKVMVQAAQTARRPLIEAFHYRYHNVMRRAVAIIRSGELGALLKAEATFDVEIPYTPTELRWLPDQGGGGALMDLGCYCVHGLRSLAGCEPKVTTASCEVVRGVDQTTIANLIFPNGLLATFHTSMKAPQFAATLRVTGENGSLYISNFLAPQNGCHFTVNANGSQREEPVDGLPTYAAQLAHVADVMLRGAAPLTAGDDSVANMACIDAIYNAGGYYRRWKA